MYLMMRGVNSLCGWHDLSDLLKMKTFQTPDNGYNSKLQQSAELARGRMQV